MTRPERIVATYIGATETRGSRIRVRYRGSVTHVPYDYSVCDVFEHAVSVATGIDGWRLNRVLTKPPNPDRRVYEVAVP